jgi:hypothetical protein
MNKNKSRNGGFESLNHREDPGTEAIPGTEALEVPVVIPQATADYVNYYREMWDSENNKELKV